MGDPPVFVGAIHDIDKISKPAVTERPVGACGTADGTADTKPLASAVLLPSTALMRNT